MTRLKNVLLLNAVSSGATGLLLIVFRGLFADLFGVAQTGPFTAVGIFLIMFALWVYLESRKEPIRPKGVQWVIGADISWVIASLMIILARLFELSAVGYFVIGAVALWVAAMAFLQSKGLRKLSV